MGFKSLNIKHLRVQPSVATSGDGLREGFDWLASTLAAIKVDKSATSSTPTSNSNSNSNFTSTPNSTSTGNATSSAPNANGVRPPPQPPFHSPSDSLTNNEVLKAFTEYALPSWDHKTHIRIAYLNLKKYGRREGVKKIREGLQNFIANSAITNKNRYHETMTYFWLQMTHFAMQSMDIPLTWTPADDQDGLLEFDSFLEEYAPYEWRTVLRIFRDLMLNNAESRQQFAVPDIKPLPNIVETVN